MAERTTGIPNNGQTKSQQGHPTDRYKVCREWANFGLAILTLFVLIYYAHQTQIQAVATRVAANAAAAGVKAWVTFLRGRFAEVKDSRVYFDLALKNAGPTPATGIIVTWKVTFVPGPDLHSIQQPEYTDCPSENITTLGVVEAQRGWVMAVPSDPLDDVKLKMLTDKTAHLFVYGCVKYHTTIVF